MYREPLTVTIEPEKRKRLREIAQRRRTHIAWLVRDLLDELLAKEDGERPAPTDQERTRGAER